MDSRRRALTRLVAAFHLAVVAPLLPACAAAIPTPVIHDAEPVPEKIDRGPTSMESEIGGLNEEAMDRAFASRSSVASPRAARGSARSEANSSSSSASTAKAARAGPT
jgi:hypothetical protein